MTGEDLEDHKEDHYQHGKKKKKKKSKNSRSVSFRFKHFIQSFIPPFIHERGEGNGVSENSSL